LRTSYIQGNPHRNYVMTWNLSLQREFVPNLTAMVAYVGSHGVHQPFRADDMNDVLPTATSAGYLWPNPIGSGTVLNPNIGRIDTLQWTNGSSYNGFEGQLTKRMSHGIQVQGSYTWSKSIDGGSASIVGDPFANSISSLFFFLPKYRRSLSDFNVGQNFVANYTWFVPASSSLRGLAGWAVAGWELGGILTLRTGLPFTPLLGGGGDPLGLNNADPFDYPNRLTGSGCQTATHPGEVNYLNLNCYTLPMAPPSLGPLCTPFAPGGGSPITGTCSNLLGNSRRNSVIGPGLETFDFSLVKNTYVTRISEHFDIQFRAELFNLFNRANFNAPIDNSSLFDQTGASIPGAGMIDGTSTDAREIQFGLKVIW
jgi:hypothetical protein